MTLIQSAVFCFINLFIYRHTVQIRCTKVQIEMSNDVHLNFGLCTRQTVQCAQCTGAVSLAYTLGQLSQSTGKIKQPKVDLVQRSAIAG